MTPKIDEKPVKPEAKDLQKKASIPLCFSTAAQPNARKNALSCSVPCIRSSLALAMPSSRGGRSEAQQMRRGRAQSCSNGVPDQS